ncbi:hypothetical protein PILCRDRAFT_6895 [Piloderma croceum F 1598]|uniref:Uncharacterized protein n=1 Tax=Piloderma croceum (strain F 1598) TaxID=765440 RepID=A0A0C3G0A7_PILCF|nr:hypothetical protein PILCRDRAFT_6895 [Piloderma croceum F 1598]
MPPSTITISYGTPEIEPQQLGFGSQAAVLFPPCILPSSSSYELLPHLSTAPGGSLSLL